MKRVLRSRARTAARDSSSSDSFPAITGSPPARGCRKFASKRGGCFSRSARTALNLLEPEAAASATRRSAVRRISVSIGPVGPIERASGGSLVVLMRTRPRGSSSIGISPRRSPVSMRADAELGLLLGEAEGDGERLLHRQRQEAVVEAQAAEALGVLDRVPVAVVHALVVGPPLGLGGAAVEVEELEQDLVRGRAGEGRAGFLG